MGKGTHVTKPLIPEELSDLYQQSADNIRAGQNVLPLTGGGGLTGSGEGYDYPPRNPEYQDPEQGKSTTQLVDQNSFKQPGVLPPSREKGRV